MMRLFFLRFGYVGGGHVRGVCGRHGGRARPRVRGGGRLVSSAVRAGGAGRIGRGGKVSTRTYADEGPRGRAANSERAAGNRIYKASNAAPAPPQDVVAYAAELLGLPVPPEVAYEAAG